jgi:hypothetical protein
MIFSIAPPFYPVSQPAVLSSLTPDLGDATSVLSCVFFTYVSPVVWIFRHKPSTVGAVTHIARDPAAGQFVEELLKSEHWRRTTYDVVQVFILIREMQEALTRQSKTATVKNVKLVEDEVNNVGRQTEELRRLRGHLRCIVSYL